MNKIAFISAPNLENFMIPVAEALSDRGYQVQTVTTPDNQAIVDAVADSEVVWIEWGNELAMHLTTDAALLNQRNVILRIHSYEAFGPWIYYINWERVDHLIFVVDHIRDLVLSKVPKIKKLVKDIHVIPNGVDLDKHKFIDRPRGKNLAYVGYVNFKKGPMLLLHAFQKFVERDPEYKLHIAGKFQEERYELYFRQFMEEAGIQDNVIFNGWIEDMDKWLEDKNYIVSTSLLESQGMGILEAMAKGCKPLIHNFVGASNIYPKEYLWNTIDEFVELVKEKSYSNESYREFVESNYSLPSKINEIETILKSLKSKEVKRTNTENLGSIKPVTLTVAMMVKDEEKNLDRCLTSIKDFADEIVVIDTGSSDRSIEICKKYGARVYERPWENFSVHRNQALEWSTFEWVLTIDADEEFVGDGMRFKQALAAIHDECEAVCIWLHDLRQDGSIATKNHPARCFKQGTVHYEGTVHNEPMFDRSKTAFYYDAHLNHYGYHGDAKLKTKKSKRTIGLLKEELLSNPARTKVLFYLFQSYCDIGQVDKGLEYGEKYLAKRHEAHDFNDSVYFSMITAYIDRKNLARAQQLLDEALLIIPNDVDIATAMIELGVAMNNGHMVIDGAAKYKTAYNYLIQNPGSTGIRFTYSFKPDSLAYVLHRAAMCHFENGTRYMNELNEAIKQLNPSTQQEVSREIESNLRGLGLTTG